MLRPLAAQPFAGDLGHKARRGIARVRILDPDHRGLGVADGNRAFSNRSNGSVTLRDLGVPAAGHGLNIMAQWIHPRRCASSTMT